MVGSIGTLITVMIWRVSPIAWFLLIHTSGLDGNFEHNTTEVNDGIDYDDGNNIFVDGSEQFCKKVGAV